MNLSQTSDFPILLSPQKDNIMRIFILLLTLNLFSNFAMAQQTVNFIVHYEDPCLMNTPDRMEVYIYLQNNWNTLQVTLLRVGSTTTYTGQISGVPSGHHTTSCQAMLGTNTIDHDNPPANCVVGQNFGQRELYVLFSPVTMEFLFNTCQTSPSPATCTNVTFNVDASNFVPTPSNPNRDMYMDISNVNIAWSNSRHRMIRSGNSSFYTVTVPLKEGSYVYNFKTGPNVPDESIPCDCSYGKERPITVLPSQADSIIPVVCYGTCSNQCPANQRLVNFSFSTSNPVTGAKLRIFDPHFREIDMYPTPNLLTHEISTYVPIGKWKYYFVNNQQIENLSPNPICGCDNERIVEVTDGNTPLILITPLFRSCSPSTSPYVPYNAFVGGRIFHDANNNSLMDNGEVMLDNINVYSDPSISTSTSQYNGYSINVQPNLANTVSVQNPFPGLYNFNPSVYNINPTSPGVVPGNFDFPMTLTPNIDDLELYLSTGPARPGFEQWVNFTIHNVGSTTPIPQVRLVVPSGWAAINSIPQYSHRIGDTLFWNISQPMQLFTTLDFRVRLQVPVNATRGDIVFYTACANIPNESTIVNNCFSQSMTITGSYDPNDKAVIPSYLPIGYDPNRELIYTIRFQNTGNDTAFTVIVRDELSPMLRPGTVRIVNASHPYLFRMEDNRLEFIFNNILLVDSFTNEPLSHGFIQFSVRPVAGLPENTSIDNTAAIYFDFNPPIITNTVSLPILVSTSEVPALSHCSFTPNPNDGQVLFKYNSNGTNCLLRVFDVLGRNVGQIPLDGAGQSMLNFDYLPKGIYFTQLYVGEKVVGNSRFVRQ